jgi:hypothetical protein
MSSNRSLTKSEAQSLLSIAKLKMTRSRHDRPISRRTRMDQTCFASRGFFWPISNPLFQGRLSLPTGRTGMGAPPPPARRVAPSRALYIISAEQSGSLQAELDRPLLAQSGLKATTIRSASSRKSFLAGCAYGSMRTPGLSMPCGSNSRLAPLRAAAKSSGRCRSYQDL